MFTDVEFRHAHLFGAIGGGAKGFKKAQAASWATCARAFAASAASTSTRRPTATSRAWSACRRPRWTCSTASSTSPSTARSRRRAGAKPPADMHRAYGHERPHVVFLSAPCKGFSGLLSETKSLTDKYQALNRLTLRGIWLMLEAYKDDPVELIVFENVPRIATRGRHLLDQIVGLLRAYGYAVAETTHDCGELGGLAQSASASCSSRATWRRCRRSCTSRTRSRCAPWANARQDAAARRRRSRARCTASRAAVEDVGAPRVRRGRQRLAQLNKLAVEDGVLRDYLLVPTMHGGAGREPLGRARGTVVAAAAEQRPSRRRSRARSCTRRAMACAVGCDRWRRVGRAMPSNGRFAVADPRAPVPARSSSGSTA
jgi:hypothetical protein